MEKKVSVNSVGETFLSWFTLIVLIAAVGLLGLLSYRVLQLQNYLVELSTHLDEHLSVIEAETNVENSESLFTGEIDIANAPTKGNLNSSELVIVEFSDFECPFCAQATTEINQLIEEFPDQIALIHKDYPLPNHKYAEGAAIAARCAGEENKYWEMYDLLFENQQDLTNDNLISLARSIGLNIDAFTVCRENSQVVVQVTNDQNDGLELKIDRTPTFIIGKIESLQNNTIRISGEVVGLDNLTDKVNQYLSLK